MDDEKICMDLIVRARKLLEQNRREGLKLAQQAAEMDSVPIRMKVISRGLLEAGLRKSGEFQAALEVCQACIADPAIDQRAKRIFERSAARCEWRLGKADLAIARLKTLLAQDASDDTQELLSEIEESI